MSFHGENNSTRWFLSDQTLTRSIFNTHVLYFSSPLLPKIKKIIVMNEEQPQNSRYGILYVVHVLTFYSGNIYISVKQLRSCVSKLNYQVLAVRRVGIRMRCMCNEKETSQAKFYSYRRRACAAQSKRVATEVANPLSNINSTQELPLNLICAQLRNVPSFSIIPRIFN